MSDLDFSAQEIEPVIREVIEKDGSFRLFPKGNSMLPFIREGKDSVILVLPQNLKKHDIVFYRRPTGQYVIHRIIKIKNDSLTLLGDNQFALEKGVKRDSIIAKVSGIYRREKLINVNGFGYKLCVCFWVNTRLLRRIYRGLKAKLKKCLIFKGK